MSLKQSTTGFPGILEYTEYHKNKKPMLGSGSRVQIAPGIGETGRSFETKKNTSGLRETVKKVK